MEIVAVAVIQGAFALILLVVGAKLNGKINRVGTIVQDTKEEVRETKHEVKNSHTTNFRDDMDSKFMMTNSLIRGVQATQARHGSEIVQLRTDMANYIETSANRDQEVRAELLAFRKTLKS